jgi:hypothetical protein
MGPKVFDEDEGSNFCASYSDDYYDEDAILLTIPKGASSVTISNLVFDGDGYEGDDEDQRSPTDVTLMAAVPALEVGRLDVTVRDPLLSILALAGNQKIWLIYEANAPGTVSYEYRTALSEAALFEATWQTIPADAEQPFLVANVTNGVALFAQGRILAGELTLPSNVVSVTPRGIERPDADIGISGTDEVVELVAVNGKAVLEIPFTFTNTGEVFLANVWLLEDELISGGRILDLRSDQGTLTRYGNRWYWRGLNLEPGDDVAGVIDVEVER